MNTIVIVADAIAAIAFAATIFVLLAIPTGIGSGYSKGAKAFSAAACMVYVLVATSDVMDRLGITGFLEPIEDQVELLWAPLVLFAIYSLYARAQLNEADESQRRALAAGDLTRRIVETTPAGIVMIDQGGNLTFANRAARELLDLDEDPATGATTTPVWAMRVSQQGQPSGPSAHGFESLATAGPLKDANMVVEWPTGWRRRLSVNTVPMSAPDGEQAGVLAAFVEHEPWRTRPRQ